MVKNAFTDVTFESRLFYPTGSMGAGVADLDNDGYVDVYLGTGDPQISRLEPNRLFRLGVAANPGGEAGCDLDLAMLDAGAAQDADGYGTGAVVCDIDGDGVLELLVCRGEKAPQPLAVFKARAPYRNWLRVRPLTRFGAPARGAVVRAEYGGRVRVKGICAGSGYLCQMEPVAHFGLGDARRGARHRHLLGRSPDRDRRGVCDRVRVRAGRDDRAWSNGNGLRNWRRYRCSGRRCGRDRAGHLRHDGARRRLSARADGAGRGHVGDDGRRPCRLGGCRRRWCSRRDSDSGRACLLR